jgi:hypothetical protein
MKRIWLLYRKNHLRLLVLFPVICFGRENQVDSVSEALMRQGFENVAIYEDTSQIVVTYENRIYRYEVRALREVMKIAASNFSGRNVAIVIQHQGIPITAVIGKLLQSSGENRDILVNYKWNTTFDVEPYWKKVRNIHKSRASYRKLDVVLYPQIKAQFGNYNNPIESQVNIAPALHTTLWKGMSLMLQWIVPLQNELGYEGNHGRPGLLTLSQWIRMPFNTFFSTTTGYFTEHRYGFDFECIKFWDDGRWMVLGNAGYTGYASYLDKTWYYSDLDRWTWFLGGAYRFENLDFTIHTTYGQFLYADKGWRIDFSRQFGEMEIGFFAMKTEGGGNGGFNFSLPIFPMKRLKPYRVRVSPEAHFPWEYRYRGLRVYGREYKTCEQLDFVCETWNPLFINNQINKNLNEEEEK